MQNIRAEAHLTTRALPADIGFFTKTLGMRMERIFPADDPRVAVFSGHGLRLRLMTGDGAPGTIGILADDPVLIASGATELVSPGGTRVVIGHLDPPLVLPPTEHAFVVRRLADQVNQVQAARGAERNGSVAAPVQPALYGSDPQFLIATASWLALVRILTPFGGRVHAASP